MNNYIRFAFIPISLLFCLSCARMKNLERPLPPDQSEGSFFHTSDSTDIFVYSFEPKTDSSTTIYILTGYTGINHNSEKDVIELLSNQENRVVVIHPRGTGYSEGKRGDVKNYARLLQDFIEIIDEDIVSHPETQKVVLFGHSISTAIALYVAQYINKTDGIILINPPYKLKSSKGMKPSISDYLKYAGYMIVAPHTPIVNMAGNPEKIENPEERSESLSRSNDPLLVKYISMYLMLESKKLLDKMIEYSLNANYPLLLLYGSKDGLVDQSGCEAIFNAWKNSQKNYYIIQDGPHGKQTVCLSKDIILSWLTSL